MEETGDGDSGGKEVMREAQASQWPRVEVVEGALMGIRVGGKEASDTWRRSSSQVT